MELHNPEDKYKLMYWERFCSSKKFIHIVACIFRFDYVRKAVSERDLQGIFLNEAGKATFHVLRLLQRAAFAKQYISLKKGERRKELSVID